MIYKRNCPKCNKIINYSHKNSYCLANKKNSKCKACASLDNQSINNSRGKPSFFAGKKHSEKTKEKLSEINLGKKQSIDTIKKKSIASKGMNNPMFGKKVYDCWLEKYGKEIADSKLIEFKQKISKNSSGKNNPMYGKSSPSGSGVGWKGWYDGLFFRSLRELSYLIYLKQNNIQFISAENKKFLIEYVNYDGRQRTYKPDFLINNNTLVEIKPKRLHNTPLCQLKKIAAEKFCIKNNYKYLLIDIEINFEEILKLHYNKQIKWIKDYGKKFETYVDIKRTSGKR